MLAFFHGISFSFSVFGVTKDIIEMNHTPTNNVSYSYKILTDASVTRAHRVVPLSSKGIIPALPLCRLLQGSLDNMSIIIVTFPGAPQVSQEALQKEAKLETILEAKVEGRNFDGLELRLSLLCDSKPSWLGLTHSRLSY